MKTYLCVLVYKSYQIDIKSVKNISLIYKIYLIDEILFFLNKI